MMMMNLYILGFWLRLFCLLVFHHWTWSIEAQPNYGVYGLPGRGGFSGGVGYNQLWLEQPNQPLQSNQVILVPTPVAMNPIARPFWKMRQNRRENRRERKERRRLWKLQNDILAGSTLNTFPGASANPLDPQQIIVVAQAPPSHPGNYDVSYQVTTQPTRSVMMGPRYPPPLAGQGYMPPSSTPSPAYPSRPLFLSDPSLFQQPASTADPLPPTNPVYTVTPSNPQNLSPFEANPIPPSTTPTTPFTPPPIKPDFSAPSVVDPQVPEKPPVHNAKPIPLSALDLTQMPAFSTDTVRLQRLVSGPTQSISPPTAPPVSSPLIPPTTSQPERDPMELLIPSDLLQQTQKGKEMDKERDRDKVKEEEQEEESSEEVMYGIDVRIDDDDDTN